MKSWRWTRFAAIVAVALVATLSPVPAQAAPLLSATWETEGSGNTTTGARNTQFDWAFTTANTRTLGSVSMTMPSGTKGIADPYLALPGRSGNYASTPDSVSNSVTGDIDIRAKVALKNWSGNYATLVGKVGSGFSGPSYWFGKEGGSKRLYLALSQDGSTWPNNFSNVALPVNDGDAIWVRAAAQVNTPAGSATTSFYHSSDGTNWTQLGSPVVTSGIAGIADTGSPLYVGSRGGDADLWQGKAYFASVSSGINGTTTSSTSCSNTGVVACFNPADSALGAASWSSSSARTETWTVSRNGVNAVADVAYDLTASRVTGVPTGGKASFRSIDGEAVYEFVAQTVAYSTASTVTLAGFENTATAGSYTSTIATRNNSADPVDQDTGTTAAINFTTAGSEVTITASIAAELFFTVAGRSAACGGVTPTVIGGSSTVDFGQLPVGYPASATQDLSVSTNAAGGFVVYQRGGPFTGPRAVADVVGTNAAPAAFGSGERFGYTTDDTDVPGFAGPLWAALSSTNAPVMSHAGTADSVTNCVAYQIAVTPTTPAGTYSTTVTYTAVPTF